MIQGIDVSRFQGVIDWKTVGTSGIKFALIRAGYGDNISQKDKNFDANIVGALAAGLDVGVYWFSYATSVENAKKESAVFRQVISPYRSRITFPAAYDYEYDSISYAKKQGISVSNDLINQMTNAFLTAMKDDKWMTALYTNNDYRKNVFSAATLKEWDLWLADYSGEPDVPCQIQQTANSGNVSGIPGNVDLDVSFKDYAALSGTKTAVAIDTTGTFIMHPGNYYQLKTTCAQPPQVWSGNSKVALVLPRYRSENENFWWIVALGKAGDGAGIYTAGPGEQGIRRLIVSIK